jgi:hypothetical protein
MKKAPHRTNSTGAFVQLTLLETPAFCHKMPTQYGERNPAGINEVAESLGDKNNRYLCPKKKFINSTLS